MALQKTVVYREVEVVNAYHRIAEMSGRKEDGVFQIWFSVFVQANSTSQPLEQKQNELYTFPYNLGVTTNAITQAYDFLKTLEEYDGATDV